MRSKTWLCFVVVLAACGDEKKRPIGSTCGDSAECASGLCLVNECVDPAGDADQDGLTNGIEASLGSDYRNPDTDGDGVPDLAEFGPGPNAIDSDGDGIPDLLESLLADQDRDCKNDQIDATNTVADNRDPALIAAVCPAAGVCATHASSLAVVCPNTLDAPECDLSAVIDYGVEVCDDLDNDCDGDTDEGLVCDPVDADSYVILNPYWAIEDIGTAAVLVPGYRILEGMTFSASGFSFDEECVSDGLVITSGSSEGAARTTTWCIDEEVVIDATLAPGTLTIESPHETSTNPHGYQETTEAHTLVLSTVYASEAPADADLLFGGGLREYTLDDGESPSVTGKEINLFAAIKKGAREPSLGDWGLIGFFLTMDPSAIEIEYGVGAFFANIVRDEEARTFSLVAERSIEAVGWQGYGGPNDLRLSFGEPDPLDLPPLVMVVDDGRVRMTGDGADFLGALSPRGDFVLMASTHPEVGLARGQADPIYDLAPHRLGLELLIGVKRVADPSIVAAKAYRVYRFEFIPELGHLGIGSASGTLTFDPSAKTATLRGDLFSWVVGVDGGGLANTSPDQSLGLDVTFPGDGSITLVEPSEEGIMVIGFAGEDGRILVLGDHSTDDREVPSGRFALMIAVCTNCDSPTAGPAADRPNAQPTE